ncbi:unnamed protein product [Bemisia tabaci]|uniref:Uncharacterized protein n=1 Tax=Bemisia tabaci TaxID=7038 RepID=A0A9P0AFS5_BEMTA|nr:unnamed protein product [Bemisia tabaci]
MKIKDINSEELEDFIDCRTRKFFDRFKLSMDFMQNDPSTWEQNKIFQANLKIIDNLKSVNDTAERGIKLIEEYSEKKLTRDENERQHIIQVVAEHRKQHPDVKKSTLLKPYL